MRIGRLFPIFFNHAAAAVLAALLLTGSAWAQALEKELHIVTSFSKDIYDPFKAAFEKKFPGTAVNVNNKNTAEGITFVRETRSNRPDIFWASAPDAFEVLKAEKQLAKIALPAEIASAIPKAFGSYPIHDPDGYYFGFAGSGYGVMWNTRYVERYHLPIPEDWVDLTKPVYFGHLAISSPARSGTTHLTVETILQGVGWEEGWRETLAMGGNMKTITSRSFGVPEGVNNGQFGFGIVIDFFGLSAEASGFPVKFIYPKTTSLVPANVAVISGATHPHAAAAFVTFLLSEDGQRVLLDPKVRRLPVLPAMYKEAPPGFPNPFTGDFARVTFNSDLSEKRYNLVNSLYDTMITFRHDQLKAAWKAIHEAEPAVARSGNAEARALLAEARKLASTVPISEKQANDPKVAGVFIGKKAKAGSEMAKLEESWDRFARQNYDKAQELANRAQSMAR